LKAFHDYKNLVISTTTDELFKFLFRVASGEALPLNDRSVALVQVATGLMFLDHEKFYRECDRVLVPGGVIAAFTYNCQEYRVVGHPNAEKLSRIMNEVINQ